MICATNDGKLIKECKKNGVPTVRGFRLLLRLVNKGLIMKGKAVRIAEGIIKINPQISEKVLNEFLKEVQ